VDEDKALERGLLLTSEGEGVHKRQEEVPLVLAREGERERKKKKRGTWKQDAQPLTDEGNSNR